MTTIHDSLTIDSILELIDRLSPEEQVLLFKKMEQKPQLQKKRILDIPADLTHNPLLNEVRDNIEAYRRELDSKTDVTEVEET